MNKKERGGEFAPESGADFAGERGGGENAPDGGESVGRNWGGGEGGNGAFFAAPQLYTITRPQSDF